MRFNFKRRWLVVYFLITLIVTNIALLATENIPPVAYCAYLFLPAGVSLLWLIALRREGIMYLLLLPMIFIHCAQMVLLSMWGGSIIASDMFRNIFTTNTGEATELLANLWPVVLFVAVLFLPAIWLAIKAVVHKETIERGIRIKALKCAIALLAIGGISFYATRLCGHNFSIRNDIYPANALYNLKLAIKFSSQIDKHKELSKDFRYNASKSRHREGREIYIMVVGETSRAYNFGLYGYNRNTTPRLQKCNGLVTFRDALTQSNATHKIVPLILTPAEASNYEIIYGCKSILTAFKEAGFKSIYISNHSYSHTLMDHFATEADLFRSMRKESGGRSYDIDALPIIEQECDNAPEQNLFILLHIYGSHYKYSQRYRKDFSNYLPDKIETLSAKHKEAIINAYDNSILALDSLLVGVTRIIEEKSSTGAMLYLSDHGEDLMDDSRERMLHSSPIPTIYQARIPFLLWFSQGYREAFPQIYHNAEQCSSNPISSNAAFHTMLDIASISTPYLKRELSVVSDSFKVVPREYLTDHNLPVKVKDINWDKRDLEVFERDGIAF